ncbi:uncharacterized protein AC631_03178 [Debaryomyces fabryi]|uniref:Kinetochore protein mis13 n=1 Tax=Debaryomyces fabryi TaxID=58627 RepID=A0A0V1PXS1_9ASCO|nr:uncharacterized protein AC631_03178 [Debaryomyces fabryi]KSA01054.1 hypothetical protein AC631_03178 [Debaryomyces fabryi]CUM47630.1 unnamed protein product [Debaryomyces fabryi]
MGPKKKQVSNKLGTAPKNVKSKAGTANYTKTPNKSSISPATNRKNKTSVNDSESDNDSEYYSGHLQSQPSQLLLGRKNRLNDLLTSSQTSHTNNATKNGPKGKKAGNRTKSKFEEDDGFIYKRDQDNDKKRRPKPANSLISQLKEETNQISNYDSLSHLEFEEPSKKRSRKETKTSKSNGNKTKAKAKPNGITRRQTTRRKSNFHDDSSLQLSSPIKSPSYEDFYSARSSDEYEEQVSHLKMNLEDSDTARSRNQKAPNAKNKRRASYYNRGKRVLSIGNGFVGVPHEDVPTSDYYKLLDTSLPEPHRMRQLLIWSFKKKLDQEEKLSKTKSKTETTEDQTVINIAKVIKEEVLRDLVDGQISISWYNRDENEDETNDNLLTNKEVTLPNPLNITNEENIEIFTKKLKSLKQERLQWESSFNRSTSHIPNLKIDADQSEPDLQEYCQTRNQIQDNSVDFNSTVLNNSLVDKINKNYNDISESVPHDIETSTDKLFDTSYRLSQASDLIAKLQNDKLNDKVSSLVQNYMTKHLREPLSLQTSSWPVPNRQITTKELLRGITRLDDPGVSQND